MKELTRRGGLSGHADHYHDGAARAFVATWDNWMGPLPAGQIHVGRLVAEAQMWRGGGVRNRHSDSMMHSGSSVRLQLWELPRLND